MVNTAHFIRHKTRLVVYPPYGDPSHPAYSLQLDLGGKYWKTAQARGVLQGIARYDLDQFDPDDPKRARRAISLETKPRFEDRFNRLGDWTSIISSQEKAYRRDRLETLVARRDELQSKSFEDRSEDEETELAELNLWIDKLWLATAAATAAEQGKAPGPGWFESAPNGFGDNSSTLYSPLNEPNIPTRRVSNFEIESDTPFSARFYFWKPNEEQADWFFQYQWGYYRLIFKQDSVQFIRLNSDLSATELQEKEQHLELLLDESRITRDDTIFKGNVKKEITNIKADAQANADKKPTAAQLARIKELEQRIDRRWESKRRRSAATDEQINRLQKEIYKETENVSFGQSFETFFNQDIVLSFLPQRRGYLTIQLEGAGSWSHEIKEILKTRKPGTIWKRAKLEIQTNGGAYKWQTGIVEPTVEIGRYPIGPLDPGFDPDGMEFDVGGHWDEPAETQVAWEMMPADSDGHVSFLPGNRQKWQVNALLAPSPLPVHHESILAGRRIPYVYDAFLFIPAGPRVTGQEVLWDSAEHPTESGESAVVDLSVSWDESGGTSCQIELRDSDQNLPPIDGCLADLYIDEIGDGAVPFLAKGSISQTTYQAVDRAGSSPVSVAGGTVSFLLSDRRALLSEQMSARPVGDNRRLGQHIRTVLACRGETADELSAISAATGPLLEESGLGDEPAYRPAQDATYVNYIDELLQTVGLEQGRLLQLLWRSTAAGGRWSLAAPSPSVAQLPDESGALQPAEFRSDADFYGRFKIRQEISLPDDDSEVYNGFRIEGDINPETKERFTGEWIVWESVKREDDLRYIGRVRWYRTVRIESIKSADAAIRAAKALSVTHCRSKKFIRFSIPFIRGVGQGIPLRADGRLCEIKRMLDSSIDSDQMEILCRRLE